MRSRAPLSDPAVVHSGSRVVTGRTVRTRPPRRQVPGARSGTSQFLRNAVASPPMRPADPINRWGPCYSRPSGPSSHRINLYPHRIGNRPCSGSAAGAQGRQRESDGRPRGASRPTR